ncbi:hypothetical protein BIW11_02563 [Tropilaelaps mercedesae]|uniref:Uncharacterized protein n=1 Tax=Tropilaelaps mercedesae TaxID=418985 RepID=A0A1V9Y0Y5_9ACAR|nr:hypothetical protein BIW11_02563 [Tropilaelaps mercedesae]
MEARTRDVEMTKGITGSDAAANTAVVLLLTLASQMEVWLRPESAGDGIRADPESVRISLVATGPALGSDGSTRAGFLGHFLQEMTMTTLLLMAFVSRKKAESKEWCHEGVHRRVTLSPADAAAAAPTSWSTFSYIPL